MLFLLTLTIAITLLSGVYSFSDGQLRFYEEPADAYLIRNTPAVLKCKIENARTGFFKCNDQWSQDAQAHSKIIQIGNKQILTIEQAITRVQVEEHRRKKGGNFWCTCQGWMESADEAIVSQKVYVKAAYIDQTFEWEPMPTTGLIGKSVEIRCLPPEGDPKPVVYWLKNGMPIEKSNKRVLVSNEGSLLINEVRNSDSANYTCVAESIAGKSLSEPAALSVTENRGWGEWSNWTDCGSFSSFNCGEGTQRRHRVCLNPPTVNNALGCDGLPEQVVACYEPCLSGNGLPPEKSTTLRSVLKAAGAKKYNQMQLANINNNIMMPAVGLLQSKAPKIVYWWTSWSSWSMICDSDCRRSRQRDCVAGYYDSTGKLVELEDKPDTSGKCPGSDIDYSNCTFYCEKVTTPVPDSSPKVVGEVFSKKFIIAGFCVVIGVFFLSLALVAIRKRRQRQSASKRRNIKHMSVPQLSITEHDQHPIYYSVQPDYSQETYMDICTLLPQQKAQMAAAAMAANGGCGDSKSINANQMNFAVSALRSNGRSLTSAELECKSCQISSGFLNIKKTSVCNGNCNMMANTSGELSDASRNSTATTTSGSNSTTSSKIKLTSSPTDSLVKSTSPNCLKQAVSPSGCPCCSSNMYAYGQACENTPLVDDFDNNAYQIMKLINEHKTCVCPTKSVNAKSNNSIVFNAKGDSHSMELYAFNVFKSGGFLEVPKYAFSIMVPDDTFAHDVSSGILRSNQENYLRLSGDETLLSSIFVVKSDNMHSYVKPIILSLDHAAQFAENDWETSIFYKSPASVGFEEINEKVDATFYSHIVGSKCFIMTEKDGMYALVGRPKSSGASSNMISCIKEMKYALVLTDSAFRIMIAKSTTASIELLNEEIQRSNGRIVRMPESFELNYPKMTSLENAYLALVVDMAYNNQTINSDSACYKMKLSDLWNTSKDLFDISIPINVKGGKQSPSGNGAGASIAAAAAAASHQINFEFKVSLDFEERTLFSYSNSNSLSEYHTAKCSQQEFYSSVSVSPVFIPLKITDLLDEYILRCFKMNSLKKADWRLFANLLKCDKNVQYFANKDNSFELIISLWLMINLNRAENENLTVNLLTKHAPPSNGFA